MSQAVYPQFEGLGFPVEKIPNWSTRMQKATSGRVLRTADYVNPVWNFKLSYDVLEDLTVAPASEIRQTYHLFAARHILNFFNSRAGAFDDFLYEDPRDNTSIGANCIPYPTDTTGTMFQLTRTLTGDIDDDDVAANRFQEWIIAPNVVSAVYWNGQPQSPAGYSVDPLTGIITFLTPVGGGITVTADFTFYFRVYFTDSINVSYFMQQLAELRQVKLTSVVGVGP